jgi:glycosyltransferase involved in cell wall biosynthesis
MLLSHIQKNSKNPTSDNPSIKNRQKSHRLNQNKIMLIGMADSPHFQKWLKVAQEEFPHKVFLIFPSDRPRFKNSIKLKYIGKNLPKTKMFRLHPNKNINFAFYYLFDNIFNLRWRAYFLARFIMIHKPSVIHFHEMQHGAYIYNLISGYKNIPKNSRKIISTWGSDLTLYSWVDQHQFQLRTCLTWADILTAERITEIPDAKKLGFEGEFIAPLYITIGQDPLNIAELTKSSSRKIILIKGHQSDTGRALNVLHIISTMSSYLTDFKIFVYSAPSSVQIQVDLLRNKNKIDIQTLPKVGYSEMRKLFEQARLSISLSVSDGLPGVLVEAMSAGAFPIQSENSAGREFIVNNENGLLVDPWDFDSIKESILKALTDDYLVDKSAELNQRILQEKYSMNRGRLKLKQLYL